MTTWPIHGIRHTSLNSRCSKLTRRLLARRDSSHQGRPTATVAMVQLTSVEIDPVVQLCAASRQCKISIKPVDGGSSKGTRTSTTNAATLSLSTHYLEGQKPFSSSSAYSRWYSPGLPTGPVGSPILSSFPDLDLVARRAFDDGAEAVSVAKQQSITGVQSPARKLVKDEVPLCSCSHSCLVLPLPLLLPLRVPVQQF